MIILTKKKGRVNVIYKKKYSDYSMRIKRLLRSLNLRSEIPVFNKVRTKFHKSSNLKLKYKMILFSGMTKDLKDREATIVKLRNKQEKMEAICRDINTEYVKLKEILSQRESDYRQLHIHHEELTQFVQEIDEERNKLAAGNQRLKGDNSQLIEDLKLMKSLVYKLNVEIERYQDKLRKNDRSGLQQNESAVAQEVDATIDEEKMIESWGRVNIHALGPLLDAYQENLAEKEELIKKYGNEIEEFGGRCKDVINENEILHKEVKDLMSKVF